MFAEERVNVFRVEKPTAPLSYDLENEKEKKCLYFYPTNTIRLLTLVLVLLHRRTGTGAPGYVPSSVFGTATHVFISH